MLKFMKITNSADRGSISIFGDITDDSWNFGWEDDPSIYPLDIRKMLDGFNGQPVDIHINSGGGHAFAGMAIANMLRQYSGETTCYVDGLAASAASLIALACDKVICPKNSIIMIHNPSTVAMGTSQEMLKAAEMLETLQKASVSLYKQKALDGVDEAKIQELMDAESWMTGDQAAEVFDITVEEDMQAAACVDSKLIGMYRNVPEALKQRKNAEKLSKRTENDEKMQEQMKMELDLVLALI